MSSTMLAAYGLGAAPTTTLWTDLNRGAAALVSPLRGPLDAVLKTAGVSTSDRRKITTRPLDAMLDLFDPILAPVGRAVDRVMRSRGATQSFFGTRINLTRIQPGDARADVSTRNLLASLRTIQAFIVLLWSQPDGLIYEMGREGLNMASQVGNAVANTAATVSKNVSNTAGAAVKAVTDTVQNIGKGVADFFGLGEGLGGEPVTVAATAAATGVAATAGAALQTAISAAITAIVGAIGAGITVAITNAVGRDRDDEGSPGQDAATRTVVLAPAGTPGGSFNAAAAQRSKDNTLLYVGGAAAIIAAVVIATR